MRIISDFKDYYDSVARHGVSNDNVWIRKIRTETISRQDVERFKIRDAMPLHDGLFYSDTMNFDLKINLCFEDYSSICVLFCGRIYYIFEQMIKDKPGILIRNGSDYEKYIKTNKIDLHKTKHHNGWRYYYFKYSSVKDVYEFYEKHNGAPIKPNVFVEYDSPIMTFQIDRGSPKSIVINPQLKRYGFESVVNPYDAYQTIEQYRFGVLSNTNEKHQSIDDKIMAAKKGFDKWSFKKMPENKKC